MFLCRQLGQGTTFIIELSVSQEGIIESAEVSGGTSIFIIDLDDFKPINDTYGHGAGDIVLIEIANRLQSFKRQNNIAARLGGDEFLFAIPGKLVHKTVVEVAERLLDNLVQPMTIENDIRVKVGVSIGIALSGDHGSDRKTLMIMADKALYQIKDQGKNNYYIMPK